MSLLEQPLFSAHQATVTARWESALAANHFDCAVVSAGANQNYFLDDQAPPFRPNPHFAQFYPDRDSEHCELIVTPGETPRLLFYQPKDFWHMQPKIADWANQNFIVETHDSTESLAAARDGYVRGHNNVAHIGPMPLMSSTVDTAATGSTTQSASTHNPVSLIAHLDFLRSQKTPFEVAAMRESTAQAVRGHLVAKDAFYAGASEYDIYMQYLTATTNTAAEQPYSSIVALNEHAGVLHYQHYDRQVPPAHLSFLIDAGASHLGYASDITRTYGGTAAPAEFVEMIRLLDHQQLELIDSIHVGQPYEAMHQNMIERIAGVLTTCGVLTCSLDEAIAEQRADPFMPHGLGHLIGLQTHDVGGQQANTAGKLAPPSDRFPALRLTRPLENDAVFTIEPGIYFIPMLLDALRGTPAPIDWALVDALTPCGGIRIEDNVWLTNDGAVNLTRQAFTEQELAASGAAQ